MNDDLVRIAEGREAEVFLRADGRVLKLLRNPDWAFRLEREAAALAVLQANGISAPTAHGLVEVDGRPGLVLERLDGVDLLTRLNSQPWQVVRAGTVLGRTHAAMHDCVAPATLPDLNDDLRQRIDAATALPPRLAEHARRVLAGLDGGDRLCHGDFHVGNILGDWNAPAIIDWGDATRGNPVADVARTELLLRLGEPPPGTGRVVKTFSGVGRQILCWRYMAVYGRVHPVGQGQLRDWEVVRAAARFVEGVDSEHEALAAVIDAHLRAV